MADENTPLVAWTATVRWLQEECGLDASGTETLVRLAVSTADSTAANPYQDALTSFSEPDEVDGLAKAVASRIYPDTQRDRTKDTWTFCGHWVEDEIVVDYVLPGKQEDEREDVGAYEQGLWAAAGSGATQEDAQLGVTAEYEYEHIDAWENRPAYLVEHFGGAPALFEWAGRNLIDLKSIYDLTDEQFDTLKARAEAEKPGSTTND